MENLKVNKVCLDTQALFQSKKFYKFLGNVFNLLNEKFEGYDKSSKFIEALKKLVNKEPLKFKEYKLIKNYLFDQRFLQLAHVYLNKIRFNLDTEGRTQLINLFGYQKFKDSTPTSKVRLGSKKKYETIIKEHKSQFKLAEESKLLSKDDISELEEHMQKIGMMDNFLSEKEKLGLEWDKLNEPVTRRKSVLDQDTIDSLLGFDDGITGESFAIYSLFDNEGELFSRGGSNLHIGHIVNELNIKLEEALIGGLVKVEIADILETDIIFNGLALNLANIGNNIYLYSNDLTIRKRVYSFETKELGIDTYFFMLTDDGIVVSNMDNQNDSENTFESVSEIINENGKYFSFVTTKSKEEKIIEYGGVYVNIRDRESFLTELFPKPKVQEILETPVKPIKLDTTDRTDDHSKLSIESNKELFNYIRSIGYSNEFTTFINNSLSKIDISELKQILDPDNITDKSKLESSIKMIFDNISYVFISFLISYRLTKNNSNLENFKDKVLEEISLCKLSNMTYIRNITFVGKLIDDNVSLSKGPEPLMDEILNNIGNIITEGSDDVGSTYYIRGLLDFFSKIGIQDSMIKYHLTKLLNKLFVPFPNEDMSDEEKQQFLIDQILVKNNNNPTVNGATDSIKTKKNDLKDYMLSLLAETNKDLIIENVKTENDIESPKLVQIFDLINNNYISSYLNDLKKAKKESRNFVELKSNLLEVFNSDSYYIDFNEIYEYYISILKIRTKETQHLVQGQEPSVEEILGAVRKIISNEDYDKELLYSTYLLNILFANNIEFKSKLKDLIEELFGVEQLENA